MYSKRSRTKRTSRTPRKANEGKLAGMVRKSGNQRSTGKSRAATTGRYVTSRATKHRAATTVSESRQRTKSALDRAEAATRRLRNIKV
jgi:hypothetical protein